MARLLAEVEAGEKTDSRLLSPAQIEMLRSKERQVESMGANLKESLAAKVDAWADVVDLLCCLDSAELAIKIASMIRESVDPATERALRDTLSAGTSSKARRVALALLAGRESADGLTSLVAAAEDPDPRLRLAVILALGEQKNRADAPTLAATAESALRRRAQSDPDPTLQKVARRLLGEPVASDGPPPPFRRGPILSRVGSKPAEPAPVSR